MNLNRDAQSLAKLGDRTSQIENGVFGVGSVSLHPDDHKLEPGHLFSRPPQETGRLNPLDTWKRL